MAPLFDNIWLVCEFHPSIVNEMDEPTNKLIGHHNYCTQVSELVLTQDFSWPQLMVLFSPTGLCEFAFDRQGTHDGVITLGTGIDPVGIISTL